jgi:GNAT superfamily N-acetyltransferase
VLIDSRPVIRPATAADETAITAVRRASWFAAYDGIIDHAIIDRITGPASRPADPPPYHRTIVAVAPGAPASTADRRPPAQPAIAGLSVADAELVIGYATFGPERMVPTAIPPAATSAAVGTRPDRPPRPPVAGTQAAHPPRLPAATPRAARPPRPPAAGPLTPEGVAGQTGELYALYLAPAWWSAGVGRALTETVLASLWEDGYRRVVLWVLTGNARARRFYQRAGFAHDGTTNMLTGIGNIEELRYARDL